MGPKKTILAPLKDLTTSPKTRDLGRFCMLKMLPKRKKSAPKRRIGAKNRGQDATENYKFGRVERFDNLSKNKGFGEVLHVKNVAQNDKKGNKIEAENANEKRQKRSH